MDEIPLPRRAAAEAIGTAALVASVVGSGIAASRLSDDPGIQLLANSLATALALTVIILVVMPVSGAHLNPVVSIADAVLGRRHRDGLRGGALAAVIAAQLAGAIAGAVLANLMFEVPTAISTTDRASAGTVLGEIVATAGLIVVIVALLRTGQRAWIAPAVGAYIGAAYWVTSSTAFANPAVTIGRIVTDTFAGIAPVSALLFIAAQIVGAAVGLLVAHLLFPPTSQKD